MEGDDDKHETYRKECIKYIRKHKDDYVPFIEDDETIREYCDTMQDDGIWGGQLEMNALAQCYKFNVVVH